MAFLLTMQLCYAIIITDKNRNLQRSYKYMKNIIMRILLAISLILSMISLIYHNDVTLIIAALLIAVCIVVSFVKKQ